MTPSNSRRLHCSDESSELLQDRKHGSMAMSSGLHQGSNAGYGLTTVHTLAVSQLGTFHATFVSLEGVLDT